MKAHVYGRMEYGIVIIHVEYTPTCIKIMDDTNTTWELKKNSYSFKNQYLAKVYQTVELISWCAVLKLA